MRVSSAAIATRRLLLIRAFPYSGPLEDVRLKKP
jgi:hypothetical protein